MKLQVSFDFVDIEQSLDIASNIADYVDILEVGTILIYKYGISAIEQFNAKFPHKKILADVKIVDRSKDIVPLIANAGADWLTVMAGTGKNVIHSACTVAHDLGKKVMLDLLDSNALGQSALEAKNLGVDALLFHQAHEETESSVLDKWDLVKGNTDLPIFIAAKIDRKSINEVLRLLPEGIIVGRAITTTENPEEEASYFSDLIKNIG